MTGLDVEAVTGGEREAVTGRKEVISGTESLNSTPIGTGEPDKM
jgi:hypothetical protein